MIIDDKLFCSLRIIVINDENFILVVTDNYYRWREFFFVTDNYYRWQEFFLLSITIIDDGNFILITAHHYYRRDTK